MSNTRQIDRPGSDTVYEVTGTGPPVLLGHSLLCNRNMWDGVIERLADRYTFINVALRGHNESSATRPFTLWDLADDWVAILDAEGIERAALCGLSTGGMTAMRMALRKPERVCGLALVDTDADAEGSRWNRVQYSVLGKVYRYTGFIPLRMVASSMFGPTTLSKHRERVDDIEALVRTFDRRQLTYTMKAVFGRDGVDVSSIELPTVVIVGEHDKALPVRRSEKLATTIAGARLEIIADAGHLTAVEQPEAVANVLADFLPACFIDQ